MHNMQMEVGKKEHLTHRYCIVRIGRSDLAVRQCTLVMDFPDLSSGLRVETVQPIDILPLESEHHSTH